MILKNVDKTIYTSNSSFNVNTRWAKTMKFAKKFDNNLSKPHSNRIQKHKVRAINSSGTNMKILMKVR